MASPIGAHSSGGELVQVGREDTVVLSVNAETAAALVGVDVLIPPGFVPDRQSPAEAKGGGVGGVFITWQAHYSGQLLQAGGAGVAAGGVVLVTFSGTGTHVGTLSFVTVTHAADGTTVRWDGPSTSSHPAALVYVVQSISNAQAAPTSLSGGPGASHPPWWAIGAAAAGGVALLGGVVAARRRQEVAGKVSIRGRVVVSRTNPTEEDLQ